MWRRKQPLWKFLVSGAAGGLAGAIAMTQFQNAWSKVSAKMNPGEQDSEGEHDDPATVKAAEAIASMVGKQLNGCQKQTAGSIVHYGFGTLNGLLYGALSRPVPALRAGRGALFGSALWAAADEAAVPALGLSKPPTEYPASTHLYGLASHLVYGVATESVAAALRRIL